MHTFSRYLILTCITMAGSVHAEPVTSKQEAIGVGSGAAIGAAAAGPIGAIVGAGIGAMLGDRAHRNREERDQLSAQLERSRGDVMQLESGMDGLRASLTTLQDDHAALQAFLSQGLELRVPFRTDADTVDTISADEVIKLAQLLSTMPGITLEVNGFADPRGNDEYNDNLSLRRAQFVRALLVDGGMTDDRISVYGHGSQQSKAQDGDLDAYAMDRRVTIRLMPEGDVYVARSE